MDDFFQDTQLRTAFARLASSDDWAMRAVAAECPVCPSSILEGFVLDKNVDVRRRITMNPLCPESIMERLAVDDDWQTRNSVAWSQRCPASLLDSMVTDQNDYIRRGIAYNKNCSPDTLAKLATDPDRSVRWLVVNNSNCSNKTLVDFTKSDDDSCHRVADERLSKLIMPKLEPSKKMADTAEVPSLNDSVIKELEDLGQDDELYSAFRTLADSEDWTERAIAVEAPTCPSAIPKELASDPNPEVRRRITMNTLCPQSVMERLSVDDDWKTRNSVAWSPRCSALVLDSLVKDQNELVLRGVAWNKNSAPETLAKLATCPDSSVRFGVVCNGNCSTETLEQLSADESDFIREAVAEQLSLKSGKVTPDKMAAAVDGVRSDSEAKNTKNEGQERSSKEER